MDVIYVRLEYDVDIPTLFLTRREKINLYAIKQRKQTKAKLGVGWALSQGITGCLSKLF